jgi:hypothetical protein
MDAPVVDTLLSGVCAANTPFLDQRQDAERGVFDRSMSQYAPMLPEILLKKDDNVPHWHRGPSAGPYLLRCIAECNHSDVVTRWSDHLASIQQLLYQRTRGSWTAAAEPLERNRKHHRIAHRRIEARSALFDFANDHVCAIVERSKHRISNQRFVATYVSPLTSNELMTCAGEPDRQDVEIGYGSRLVAAVRLKHGVLGNCEVAVDVKVGLHERDGGIHGNP